MVLEDQLHEIFSEVDLNKNGEVDLGEFLQVSVQKYIISGQWGENKKMYEKYIYIYIYT